MTARPGREAGPADPVPAREEHWWRDAVIYQLHVKSFFDSNDDGVGDFPGLIQKLDYIAGLGVDTVWLLPFYPSPRRDDGYDVADYRGVHPEYGTLADARRFVREAHARGLKVLADLVINHTSDQHPWFQRARRARPGSVWRNYYVWSDTDRRYAGTRIIFSDVETSNWTWDPVAKAYYWHRFYSHQPDLNFDNPRVLREIIGAMRFWLDIGVDGFRLDAVTYLVEREGTSNESLPETHEVLKKLRAAMDERHPGRIFLAEANQWPEDMLPYFGSGDECHMAFHFPLMPRMYMAIAQEDRFPISDILRQTPELPPGCQWAIFLRNHDELTLEMVTDRERDYLWATYAADKRARLNLGIRRRLAPLLERDRRRIELMNALLLSLPGTPVIYYGDEIGMGDNIFLGDRDGVRTPMQWSPDRNGGFSRADPAQLVLPVIQNPLYGYQAVNVEAQSRDPHSLLNWMRRMLALRKRSRAFGRGAMRLLYPENRKVLAYLREHEGDSILCVFNLSRAAQAVELDLSALAGRLPVEMLGGTDFPPIEPQRPYRLTLAPYGFFWFWLAPAPQALPPWHVAPGETLPELRTIVLRPGTQELVGEQVRQELEREVLPGWLPRQRWFGVRGPLPPGAVRLSVAATLPGTNGTIALAELEVGLGPERVETYFLPLAGIADGAASGPLARLVLARMRLGARIGLLADAFAADALPGAVLSCLRERIVLATDQGEIRFRPTDRLATVELPAGEPAIRRLPADASGSSLVFGEAVVLKLLRRLWPGPHPEAEMTGHLAALGYAACAPLLGEVVRVAPDGVPTTLMLARGFVRHQGDGWGWTLDWLARAVDEAALTDSVPADPFAGYRVFAAAIGRRLGEMHALLARPSDDPAFAPERAGAAERRNWGERALARLEQALGLLSDRREWKDAEEAALVAALLARRAPLARTVRRLSRAAEGALRTRIHGDFHLGQVLVVQGDAAFVGFEGDPARPVEERRAKASPLRDVAGLLRSLDYGAHVAAATEASGAATAAPAERRLALLGRWRAEAERAFLDAWREAAPAVAAGRDPAARAAAEAALLDLFLVERAAEDVIHEAANRPAWLSTAIRGLAAIADRLVGAAG
ncbi:maltose alpha-D-glucosyltransferase [Caldovatus aquaticus]|uniref:maltose alpha-D-glucosyltransferase n=1 Tax=Caldovatus aquaticus TaxID=2865671 RepID=A0ABS7F699_9PROT|nr:maltose alpha-D-glucosyltransferase [Caldovatus aquaticus]MBW8271145.1 maltose alpha-D-glucosyltransferase [Caldovatus aquaticus]